MNGRSARARRREGLPRCPPQPSRIEGWIGEVVTPRYEQTAPTGQSQRDGPIRTARAGWTPTRASDRVGSHHLATYSPGATRGDSLAPPSARSLSAHRLDPLVALRDKQRQDAGDARSGSLFELLLCASVWA